MFGPLPGIFAPDIARFTIGAARAPARATQEATRDTIAYFAGAALLTIGLLMVAWGPAQTTVTAIVKGAT